MKLEFLALAMGILLLLSVELTSLIKLTGTKFRLLIKQILNPNRIYRMQRSWPAVIDDITTAVRSGIALPQALTQAANRAPMALQPTLTSITANLTSGLSLTQSLDLALTHFIDPVGRRFLISMKIANQAGGSDVLLTMQLLSEAIRRDLELLDQLRAKQRSAITGARIAVLAPWLVIGVTSLQPSVWQAYRSSAGAVLLTAVAMVSVLAYLWMLKLAQLKLGALQ